MNKGLTCEPSISGLSGLAEGTVRRAAISVVSNIAEGQGRLTKGEFQQFLGNSRGSLLELETQLLVAADSHYVGASEFDRLQELIAEVGRLLNGLIESLRAKSKSAGA